MARCSTGDPSEAAAGWRKARRVVRMDANQFGVSTEPVPDLIRECPVDKPRNPTANLASMDARKARKRGGLLFWLLFSWPRKRKVTRSPKAIDRFAPEPRIEADRASERK
ncbi:hypothetical protein GCM10027065_02530 [Rhodanobacter koreensis]